MSGEMQERIAASIRRVDGVLITADAGRLIVHWLGQLAEITRQRNGCAPGGLVEVQHRLGEEIAAAVGDSRQRESGGPIATEFLLSEHEAWMGTAEAAAELGVSADTVRWHCRAGNLDCRKVGRQLMISVASLQDYQARRSA